MQTFIFCCRFSSARGWSMSESRMADAPGLDALLDIPRALSTLDRVEGHVARAKAMLSRLTYKPGWEFDVLVSPVGLPELFIRYPAPDRETWGKKTLPESSQKDLVRAYRTPLIDRVSCSMEVIPRTGRITIPYARYEQPLDTIFLSKRLPMSIENEDAFFCFVREAIVEAEQHELREWFRVDGVLLDDPHSQPDPL